MSVDGQTEEVSSPGYSEAETRAHQCVRVCIHGTEGERAVRSGGAAAGHRHTDVGVQTVRGRLVAFPFGSSLLLCVWITPCLWVGRAPLWEALPGA